VRAITIIDVNSSQTSMFRTAFGHPKRIEQIWNYSQTSKFFSDIHVSDGLRTSKEDRTDIEYSRHPQNAALHRRYREDTHKTPRYTERYQSDPEPVASGSRRAASARPIALRSGNGRAKDVLMRRSSAGGSLDLPDDGARSREFSALQGRIGASRRRLGNCGWERSP
jgi:hypothetical protein